MDENPNVVNVEPTTPETSHVAPVVTAEVTPPGSKTESELLLKSLQEEREKRRELEEKLESLTTQPTEDTFSDEGLALKKEISALTEKVGAIEEEKNLEVLYNQYPLLRESADRFKEFRQAEHPRAKLESVAKLFMAENGLLESQRIGLEKPTGGSRNPAPQGMTAEDVKKLRETNYPKYVEMLKNGLIKV